MSDNIREAFEAHATEVGLCIKFGFTDYLYADTAAAWSAWQAACAAHAAPAPQNPVVWPAAAHDLVRDWQTGMASSNEVCIALASALCGTPPAAEQPATVAVPRELYTCVGKGGEYELLGRSLGAGERRLDRVVVYRDTETGLLYHRTLDDFDARMALLAGGAE